MLILLENLIHNNNNKKLNPLLKQPTITQNPQKSIIKAITDTWFILHASDNKFFWFSERNRAEESIHVM